jgi:hypothetical protein
LPLPRDTHPAASKLDVPCSRWPCHELPACRWGCLRVGAKDATNSFKAYSTDFVREVGIESRGGFEIGLELTAKARRMCLAVAEVPTIWLDRTAGKSNFQLRKWIPEYLRW